MLWGHRCGSDRTWQSRQTLVNLFTLIQTWHVLLRSLAMLFQAASCAATHTWKQLPIDLAALLLIVSPSLQCSGLLVPLTKRNFKKARKKRSYFAGDSVYATSSWTVLLVFSLPHRFSFVSCPHHPLGTSSTHLCIQVYFLPFPVHIERAYSMNGVCRQ